MGGSARIQRWRGILLLGGGILLILGIAIGISVLANTGAIVGSLGGMLSPVLHGYLQRRRKNSPTVRAISQALAQIAERTPTSSLRAVLPELEVIAQDRIHHEPGAREASRAAARRIRELTADRESLPVPAAAPVPGVDVLPLPAEDPTLPPVLASADRRSAGTSPPPAGEPP